MAESDFDEEFDRRLTAIEKRVAIVLPKGAVVEYSAYGEDEEGLPVDNLDEIAVEGRCIFVQTHDPEWGPGKNYVSAEMKNPTWLQVCIRADEMIRTTGDRDHFFLEGVTVLRLENGVKIVDLDMGS